ncbi:NADH-quinone oxidoreductase subunit NuoE [bacterium]|nr:NADH-quinone oxidoreductase subunit NuoE [bacterium]
MTTTTVSRDGLRETVRGILDDHGRDPGRLIPILQAVQEEYHYLPAPALTTVAAALGVPEARVYGVATFYAHFSLEPKGRHVIRVCDGTACHVRGSRDLLDALRAELSLGEAEQTTPDAMFTLETVSCIGACGLAPAMVVDDQIHGLLTPEAAVAILRDVRDGDEPGEEVPA